MKFSIGDPVYIKSNNEEGVILEFIGNDMASVKVESKTYHVFLDDIEHPYLRWFSKKTFDKPKNVKYVDQLQKEKGYTRERSLPQGLYLVIMPIFKFDGFDDVVEKLKVYIYNETWSDYKLFYNCSVQKEQVFSFETELTSESEFYLHDLTFDEAAQNPFFSYRFIDKTDPKLDFDDKFTLKSKKLHEKLNEVRYDNKAFFHFLLIDQIKPKPKKEVVKPAFSSPPSFVKPENHFDFEKALKKSKYEVDLHIEKLYPNYRGLGASEIKQIQLRECQKALDLAVATHQQALVLIHGIGNGSLKNEIHLILDQTKWVRKYVNHYDSRYGYGATEVFFQY